MEPQTHRRANLICFSTLVAVSVFQAIVILAEDRAHNNDFKHLWAGTRILIQGGSPYDPQLMFSAAKQYNLGAINPYVYLPATGMIMSPFAGLSFPTAALAWFWLNWIVAWICAYRGPQWLGADRPWLAHAAGALFIVGAMPFYRQMTAGQMNIVLLLALLGLIGLLRTGRHTAAGVVLGLAAAYKIAPFFLIFALAGMRRWRAALAALVSFFVINLLAVLWFGWDAHADSLPVLTAMGYGQSTWAEFGAEFYRDPFNQSINSLFHHLFTENPVAVPWLKLGPAAANGLTWAVSIALLLGAAASLRKYLRRPYFSPVWSDAETALFLIAVLLMLLLPSIMWDHYAVQALPALMWVFGSDRLRRSPLMVPAAVFCFFLLAYPWRHAWPEKRAGFDILLLSIRLWGTVGLLGLLYADWADRMRQRLE